VLFRSVMVLQDEKASEVLDDYMLLAAANQG
jgi:hypothetical protein